VLDVPNLANTACPWSLGPEFLSCFQIDAPDADVTIVEYFDYNCPYCKKMAPCYRSFFRQIIVSASFTRTGQYWVISRLVAPAAHPSAACTTGGRGSSSIDLLLHVLQSLITAPST
jgi:hypothetical protein